MDRIYALLDGLLRPFSEDEKRFIRGYWDIVVKGLLTPYQRQDEANLADTINYAQLNEKSFYWPFVPETEEVTLNISSLPETLPRGLYNLECYGPPIRHEEVLTLPLRIDDAYDVTCESRGVIIDGNIVLGTGQHTVVWWTTRVRDFTYADRVLNSSHQITRVIATHGSRTTNWDKMTIKAEIFSGDVFFVESPFTKYMTVGSTVRIRGSWDETVEEIIDTHRFRVSCAHGVPGEVVDIALDVFPYVYPCEMENIPEFREGYKSGVDYILQNGEIAFPFPVTEPLIALRAYKPSTVIYDRYVQYMNEHPDETSLYKVWWHDVFTGGLEMFVHAAMGYPYTLPEMGNQTCVGFEYTREWGRGKETFTKVEDVYNRVSGMFTGNENGIRVSDGRMYKIIRHYIDGTAELDREIHADSFEGESGYFVVSSIILSDDVASERHYAVPSGCFPTVTPGAIVPPWTKLTTGVRVFDRTERPDYINFEDVTKFTVPGQTVSNNVHALSMLAFNTLVIEVDSPFEIEDRLVRYLIPSWSQYHVKNRHERLRLFDFMDISSAAILLFAKILPVDIYPLTATSVTRWFENRTLIDDELPRKIVADYDGIATISNIFDEFGNPLDMTPYAGVEFIADYNADLATELAAANVSSCLNGGLTLTITLDNGLTPGAGNEYMIMSQSRLHVSGVTGHRGGIFDSGGMAAPETVQRSHLTVFYFDKGVGVTVAWDYIPAIYSLGDNVLNDRFKQEFTASIGTALVGDTVSYTDFKRQGTRKGMFFCNDTDAIQVDSFTIHGEPVLSSVPVHATLTGTWGFYCFVAELYDGLPPVLISSFKD